MEPPHHPAQMVQMAKLEAIRDNSSSVSGFRLATAKQAQMVPMVVAVQAVAGATGQATMPQTKVTVKSLAHLAAARVLCQLAVGACFVGCT